MGLFSKLFSKSAGKEKPVRELSHPSHLKQGDMITLDDSFALPPLLRGQSMQIKQINTYEYEHNLSLEWVLEGKDHEQIYMSIECDDTESLVFSRKITRATVEQLFDLEQFGLLFEDAGDAVLDTTNIPDEFAQWMTKQYRQDEFARMGYYHQGQHSKTTLLNLEGASFERYGGISDDESYGVEAEVYQDGETDVSVCLYRPLSDIREYWPAT